MRLPIAISAISVEDAIATAKTILILIRNV
jgi:hypothetical protein